MVMQPGKMDFKERLSHDYIRAHVLVSSSYSLFDYADILCWSNDGAEYITNWNDGGTLRPHANIHPDNMMDYDASWNKVAHTKMGIILERLVLFVWLRLCGGCWQGLPDGMEVFQLFR